LLHVKIGEFDAKFIDEGISLFLKNPRNETKGFIAVAVNTRPACITGHGS
jgi:hypothetical protein